ncbi:AGE family epimerase/isomerase [Tundrisphaera lichenicola]|uniref:AGE family epimerase/isomerase n=1 Tax=Tundrisphaera lichenicola TaxID=2029860 RepID=UPI003EB71128
MNTPLRLAVLLALIAPSSVFSQAIGPVEARDLRLKVESLLTGELTRHWYPRSLDPDGAFHQTYARDWSPIPDENRFLVYQSRMIWTAAAFARHSAPHREEFEGYARRGVAYLDRTMRDASSGGFHWLVEMDGKVSSSRGDEKHVYGTAFALYAASTAYEITRDETARKVARDAYDWLEHRAHDDEHGGYFEAIARDGKPVITYDPSAPVGKRTDRLGVYYGFKSMNSHIHLLEAVAEYYKIEKTPAVKARLEELLTIVRDRIAAEPGALNLYLSRDWRPAPAHDSFGHDVETAYLLVDAAEILGIPEDPVTWKVARSLIDHALDWGWDDQHGGFFDKGDVFAGKAYDTTKVWWTQAEGLNALLLMDRKYSGETDRYIRAFRKQWAFIEAHMIDPEFGGWFGETTCEGRLIGDGRKATQWKANYHTGRSLMNVSKRLGELAGEAR